MPALQCRRLSIECRRSASPRCRGATADSSLSVCIRSEELARKRLADARGSGRVKSEKTRFGNAFSLPLLLNEQLRRSQDFPFLGVGCMRHSVLQRKPFHAVHFLVVLRGISSGGMKKIERDDLENTNGRSFPARVVGVSD